MLPNFRLIAATFFLGFLVMFAGLRLASSFNSFNQALPVMAAHAASISAAPAPDLRRSITAVAVSYDLRFAVSAPQSLPVVANTTSDPAGAVMLPLNILPPAEDGDAKGPLEATSTTAEPQAVVPAESATVAALPAQPEPPQQPEPLPAIEVPLPDPPVVDLSLLAPRPGDLPASPTEPKAATIELATEMPAASPVLQTPAPDAEAQAGPGTSGPAPEPANVALPPARPKDAGAAPRARTAGAKPPRKKRGRTVSRETRTPFDSPFGSFDSKPFGTP